MRNKQENKQEKLFLNSMGLVHSVVRKLSVLDNEYEDMVSIGTIGLIKAVEGFDNSKDIKFSTYATKCIKNEMFMHFRKEKQRPKAVSLNEPIGNDGEGNEITRGETISGAEDVENDFIKRETFERFMNIILNLLTPKERLVMLYTIADYNQSSIGKILDLSQSYVSRLARKVKKKVRSYLTSEKNEVFSISFSFSGDKYKISFISKDVEHFETVLQKLAVAEWLPDFKVNCNNKRIVIQVPAHPESFLFIAQIIQEIGG